MSKILVATYSLSGTTRHLAHEIAEALSADSCEITDAQPRTGIAGYLRSALEAVAKGLPTIVTECDPSDYDLVVLGAPVWAGTMASPMRSFLHSYRRQLKSVAFFCTMGGRGAEGALEEMRALCSAPTAPALAAREAQVRRGRHERALREFISSLEESLAHPFPTAV